VTDTLNSLMSAGFVECVPYRDEVEMAEMPVTSFEVNAAYVHELKQALIPLLRRRAHGRFAGGIADSGGSFAEELPDYFFTGSSCTLISVTLQSASTWRHVSVTLPRGTFSCTESGVCSMTSP
jgi:hypothetical protein